MPNNNVAILSIMSKFDEKSAREAAKRADKVYEEALSDIGNVNFDEKIVTQFNNAMNKIKKSLKGLNLSSYTNNILDSLFSDKDIKAVNKKIPCFPDLRGQRNRIPRVGAGDCGVVEGDSGAGAVRDCQ